MKIKEIRTVTKADKGAISDSCSETSGNGLDPPPC